MSTWFNLLRRPVISDFALTLMLCLTVPGAWAQRNGEKSFHAVVMDAKGVETDLKNVQFYWEEKVSETAFIPHELKHLPVKRGTATLRAASMTTSHSSLSRRVVSIPSRHSDE